MRKMICLLLALVLAAGLFTGCTKEPEATVSVQSVSMITGYGALGLNNRYSGIVEAGRTIAVQKAEGMEIAERFVEVGDEVTVGRLLFSYDTDAAQLELEKAKLEKDQLEAAVTTKGTQITQLEKQRAAAKSDAQLDYTLQIQELELDINESKINIEAKQKEIERLEKLTEDTEVRAETAGRVQAINEQDGENYDPSKPYMTLVETANYRIKGTVSEQFAASLMPGMAMVVRSRTDESVLWRGEIEMIDTDNPVQNNNNMYGGDEFTSASKYPFYVKLENDDGLMLGQHVYIEPEAGQDEQGMFLPAYYLCDVDGSPYVWAANSSDKLEKRNLTLGRYDPDADSWEILGGLTPNDYIAFPDETCVAGAGVVRYDEESFDNGMNGGDFEGGFEGEFEGGLEGEYEGGFEGNPEGEFEGGFEGEFEGNPEGEFEGGFEGEFEGSPEGEFAGDAEGEAGEAGGVG